MHLLRAALTIACRNLVAHRINRFIAVLLVISTTLLVMASGMRRQIGEGTRTSITHSFVGELQVFPDRPGREPVIYPPFNAAENPEDSRPMDAPLQVREAIAGVENVRAVVLQAALYFNHVEGNVADRVLERLREGLTRHAEAPSEETRAEVESVAAHVRQLVSLLRTELEEAAGVMPPGDLVERQTVLNRFASESYWDQLWTRGLDTSEELENQLSPLFADGLETPHLFLGADLGQLREAFPRLRIVEGRDVPAGQTGVLLSRDNHEESFKLKSVREFDLLHAAVSRHGSPLSEDPELQARARALPTRSRDILLQLDPARAAEVSKRLGTALETPETDAGRLLELLFTLDDANIERNYRILYEQVVPLVELHSVKVGESLILKYQPRSGYVRAVPVTVWGTYVLDGLPQGSSVSQVLNLMDPVTFAALHGTPSPDEEADLEDLLASFERAGADGEPADAARVLERAEQRIPADSAEARRPPSFLPEPVAFHAAVILQDPSRQEETGARIDALLASRKLDGKSLSWEAASGPYGAFALTATGFLLMAMLIVFTVIALLMNNTTLIATLQKVPEFGTIRALGAQRGFVVLLVLLESLILGCVAGGLGLVGGALALSRLDALGVNSGGNDVLAFFFGGDRLHLAATAQDLVLSLSVVVLVTVGAALYPALLANRVSPLRAMQTEE